MLRRSISYPFWSRMARAIWTEVTLPKIFPLVPVFAPIFNGDSFQHFDYLIYFSQQFFFFLFLLFYPLFQLFQIGRTGFNGHFLRNQEIAGITVLYAYYFICGASYLHPVLILFPLFCLHFVPIRPVADCSPVCRKVRVMITLKDLLRKAK